MVEQSKPFLYLLIGLASTFIIIAGIQNLAFILNPILLSIVITITVLPLPLRLARRGLSGGVSLALTFAAVLAVIALVLLLLFVGLAELADTMPVIQQAVVADTAAVDTAALPTFAGVSIADVQEAINGFITSQRLTTLATVMLSALFTGISQAFLVLLIFAFMLSSALALPSGARLGLSAQHPVIQRVASLTEDVRQYITLTTIVNFLVGIGNTILLLVLGVDLALLWGLLAWFMGYVPAVGFWIAMLPPLLLAYVEHGFTPALIVFVGYVVINGSVENIVKPRLMGQRLSISPVVVVISLFVWGWLLGAVGAILSIPLTLLIFSILEGFDSTKWISLILRTPGAAEASAERQEAFGHVRGLWDRVVSTIRGTNRT